MPLRCSSQARSCKAASAHARTSRSGCSPPTTASATLLGAAPLKWDPVLARSARDWARHLARTGRFEHSPDSPWWSDPEGENLWAGTVGYYQAESMVGLWAAEKRDYKAGVFPNNSRSGRVENVSHYTQLVWSSTGAVGCALEQGAEEDVLVCRYSQAGNVLGERPI